MEAFDAAATSLCGSSAAASPGGAAACWCGAAVRSCCCCYALASLERLAAAAARPKPSLPLGELLLHLRITSSNLASAAAARQQTSERTREDQGQLKNAVTCHDGLPLRVDCRADAVDLSSETHSTSLVSSYYSSSCFLPPHASAALRNTSASLSTSPPSSSAVVTGSSAAGSAFSLPDVSDSSASPSVAVSSPSGCFSASGSPRSAASVSSPLPLSFCKTSPQTRESATAPPPSPLPAAALLAPAAAPPGTTSPASCAAAVAVASVCAAESSAAAAVRPIPSSGAASPPLRAAAASGPAVAPGSAAAFATASTLSLGVDSSSHAAPASSSRSSAADSAAAALAPVFATPSSLPASGTAAAAAASDARPTSVTAASVAASAALPPSSPLSSSRPLASFSPTFPPPSATPFAASCGEGVSSPPADATPAAALDGRLRELLLCSRFRAAVEQQIALAAEAAAAEAACVSRCSRRTPSHDAGGEQPHAQHIPPEKKQLQETCKRRGLAAAGEEEEGRRGGGGEGRKVVGGERLKVMAPQGADAERKKLRAEGGATGKQSEWPSAASERPAAVLGEDEEAKLGGSRSRENRSADVQDHQQQALPHTCRSGNEPIRWVCMPSRQVTKNDVSLEWSRLLLLVAKKEALRSSVSASPPSPHLSPSLPPSPLRPSAAISSSPAAAAACALASSFLPLSSAPPPPPSSPQLSTSRSSSPAGPLAPAPGQQAATAAGRSRGGEEEQEKDKGGEKEGAATSVLHGEDLVGCGTSSTAAAVVEGRRRESPKKMEEEKKEEAAAAAITGTAPSSTLESRWSCSEEEAAAARAATSSTLLDVLDAVLGTIEDVSYFASQEEYCLTCCHLLADVLFTLDLLRPPSNPPAYPSSCSSSSASFSPRFRSSSSSLFCYSSSVAPWSSPPAKPSSSLPAAATAAREGGRTDRQQLALQDLLSRLKSSRRRALLLLCFLHLPSLSCCLSRLLVTAARPPASADPLPTPHFFPAERQHARDMPQQPQSKEEMQQRQSSDYERQLLRRLLQLQQLFDSLLPPTLRRDSDSKKRSTTSASSASNNNNNIGSSSGSNSTRCNSRSSNSVERKRDDTEKRGEKRPGPKSDEEQEHHNEVDDGEERGSKVKSPVDEGFDDEEASRLEELLLLTACTPRGMIWREVPAATDRDAADRHHNHRVFPSPCLVRLPAATYTLAFPPSRLCGPLHADEKEEEKREWSTRGYSCGRGAVEGGRAAAAEESRPKKIARAACSVLLQTEAIIAAAAAEEAYTAAPAHSTWDQRFAALRAWQNASVQHVARALLKTIRVITCEDDENQQQQERQEEEEQQKEEEPEDQGRARGRATTNGKDEGGGGKRRKANEGGRDGRPSLLLLQQHPLVPWRLRLQVLNAFFSKCLTCARVPLSMKDSSTPATATAASAERPLLSATSAARVAAQQLDLSIDAFRDPLTGRFSLPAGLPHESAALQLEKAPQEMLLQQTEVFSSNASASPACESSFSSCPNRHLSKQFSLWRGKEDNILGGLPLDASSTTTWLSCCVAQALNAFLSRVTRAPNGETEDGLGFFAVPLILRLVEMPLSPVRHYGWKCLAVVAPIISREEVDTFRGALLQALRDGAPIFKEISSCMAPYIHAFYCVYKRIFSDPTEADFLRGTRQLISTTLLHSDFEYCLFPVVLLHMRQLLNYGGVALTYVLRDFMRIAFRGMESRNPSAAVEGLRMCEVVFRHFRSAAVCYVNDVFSRLTMLYLAYVSPGYAALVVNGEPLPWDPESTNSSKDKVKMDIDRKEMAEEILCVVSSMRTTCSRSQFFSLLSLLSCSCREHASQMHDSTVCRYVQEFRHLCYKRLTASSSSDFVSNS